MASSILAGCWESLTLRPEDAPAPRDYYREIVRKKSDCSTDVPLLREGEVNRPYEEVSRLSSTCYPGTPAVCERTLKERACQLSADALLVQRSVASGSPPGTSHESLMAMQARAVRWTAR
ncbi:MAG TPA: hypothetical protein VFQ61_25210 [Polyangiaceae bacterium]|nr:hypothetical protein [Polyangiaceae bacterium]